MIFLTAAEANLIHNDAKGLLIGPDSVDVTLHYYEISGTVNVYGQYQYQVEAEDDPIRAHLTVVANPNGVTRSVEKAGPIDMQVSDISLLFDPTVDLNKHGLWFEVANLGSFEPTSKPPTGYNGRPTVMVAGRPVLKEVYCVVKK